MQQKKKIIIRSFQDKKNYNYLPNCYNKLKVRMSIVLRPGFKHFKFLKDSQESEMEILFQNCKKNAKKCIK